MVPKKSKVTTKPSNAATKRFTVEDAVESNAKTNKRPRTEESTDGDGKKRERGDLLQEGFDRVLESTVFVCKITQHAYTNGVADDIAPRELEQQPKKNFAKIVHAEIELLRKSLPNSRSAAIYVCVDEDRLDLMKAIMTGPYGSPYAYGLFEFDILLPPLYPEVPPKVKFMTTNHGQIRMNPNLYASGYVCLSLLGTWAGPGWVQGQSNLLQLLLSLQSMVLTPNPLYNEPGLKDSAPQSRADAYNEELRYATMRYGILAHMKRIIEIDEKKVRQEAKGVALSTRAMTKLNTLDSTVVGTDEHVLQDIIRAHFFSPFSRLHLQEHIKTWKQIKATTEQSRYPVNSQSAYRYADFIAVANEIIELLQLNS